MKIFVVFIFSSFSLASQSWLKLPDFPGSKRDDGVGVKVNNTVYFGTGLQEGWSATIDFYALDLNNHSWSTIPSMPHTTERQYACAFSGTNCFYVFGGDGVGGALNNLYRYDIVTSTWSVAASKPGNGLIAASCMAFGDKVVFVGGKISGQGPVNTEVWEYTLSSNTWLQKNNFPFGGRWRASAAALNNVGYLVFGIDANNSFRKEMYRYIPGTDVWTKVMDFPSAKGRAYAAIESTGSRLFLFGGVDSLNTLYNDVWYYNDLSGNWLNENNHPQPGRKGGMICAWDNNVIYTCGINALGRLNETWMSDVPLSINEPSTYNLFYMYPNPCENKLTLSVTNSTHGVIRKAHVVNLLGGKVREINFETGDLEIDTEDLAPGIYFIRIYGDEGLVCTKRFCRQ